MLSPADEIKNRLDIVEIIKQYVPLRPAGVNFVARCPFHNEKTASFNISPTKQVWHCFGCGKGGDLFSFIMEIEKLTFIEALRLLAPKAGVVLSQENGKETSVRNRLLDLLNEGARFYHQLLLNGPTAGSARQYVARRGLDEKTIKEWQVGFAPDSWDDLTGFLLNKGFREKEIVLAGLAANRQSGTGIYNRFRGRLMFPIREVNGNVIGFSGRLLPQFETAEKAQGKYVNSPQTSLYDKSKILFGLDKAKQAIREHNLAIVVEGQMDCVTAHQFGYGNVVASSGTALTAEQVNLLKRYTDRIAFAFDMDAGGRQALERGSDQVWQAELEAMVVTLPQGKDPDECIRKDFEGWKQSVSAAKPVMQYYFDEILEGAETETAAGRRAVVQKLLPRVARLENGIERDFWIKKLSQAVDTSESYLREALAGAPAVVRSEGMSAVEARPSAPAASRDELLSEQLLALWISFPELLGSLSPYFAVEQLVGSRYRSLYSQLVVYYNKKASQTEDGSPGFGFSDFRGWLQTSGFEAADVHTLDRLALLVERNFSDTSVDEAQVAVKNIQNELRRSYLNRRLKTVTSLLGELERSTPTLERDQRLEALAKEFNDLTEEIRQIAAPR